MDFLENVLSRNLSNLLKSRENFPKGTAIFYPGYLGCRGMKFFPLFCVDAKILRAIVKGYKTILHEKFWMKSSINIGKKS